MITHDSVISLLQNPHEGFREGFRVFFLSFLGSRVPFHDGFQAFIPLLVILVVNPNLISQD